MRASVTLPFTIDMFRHTQRHILGRFPVNARRPLEAVLAFGLLASVRSAELMGPQTPSEGPFRPNRSISADFMLAHFGDSAAPVTDPSVWPQPIPDSISFLLVYSKADFEGRHPAHFIAPRPGRGDGGTDPFLTFVRFITQHPPRRGRSVFHTDDYQITAREVVAAMRATAEGMHLPPARFTLKSLRSAMPSVLQAAGATPEDVRQAGPWASAENALPYTFVHTDAASRRAAAINDPVASNARRIALPYLSSAEACAHPTPSQPTLPRGTAASSPRR